MRTGSLARKGKRTGRYTAEGYVVIEAAGHPLANSKGTAFEHRIVLYEAIGEGPHPCHWCGAPLGWDRIAVDHLNDAKADNRPENLVPSCGPCNRARGQVRPFIRRLTDQGLARLLVTFAELRG